MIALEAVSKRYGRGGAAVESLTMDIHDGEICVLVGPSGCGKTTTLRMINRLVEPTSGRILIDGRDIMAMDAVELRRGIGYVIQHGGLFPHRRVADNVAVVPRLLGWDKERVARRVADLLELVGLDPAAYGRRYPHELSGGERQRVGVARALAAEPPVLLMDEPFGAVDPVTRSRLQQELLDLQQKLKKTIVFVTHDIDEAARLGDRIAVMSPGGVLEQYDSPAGVLGKPASPFVADFVGSEREVRRLGVVAVSEMDVFRPLEVRPTWTMRAIAAKARGFAREPVGARWAPGAHDAGAALQAELGASDATHAGEPEERWAVAVSEDGSLLGWIALDGDAPGTAADHLQPFAAQVPLGASLRAALAEMLHHDIAWLPVVDGARYLGVLTPNRIHAAMRRSLKDAGPADNGS